MGTESSECCCFTRHRTRLPSGPEISMISKHVVSMRNDSSLLPLEVTSSACQRLFIKGTRTGGSVLLLATVVVPPRDSADRQLTRQA